MNTYLITRAEELIYSFQHAQNVHDTSTKIQNLLLAKENYQADPTKANEDFLKKVINSSENILLKWARGLFMFFLVIILGSVSVIGILRLFLKGW